MNLSDVYGKSFAPPSSLGMENEPVPTSSEPDIKPKSQVVDVPRTPSSDQVQTIPIPSKSSGGGDVYFVHIEIGRDDCHLICMFLAVFIISFLFSSRK